MNGGSDNGSEKYPDRDKCLRETYFRGTSPRQLTARCVVMKEVVLVDGLVTVSIRYVLYADCNNDR